MAKEGIFVPCCGCWWAVLCLLIWFGLYGGGGVVKVTDSVSFMAATGCDVEVAFETFSFEIYRWREHIMHISAVSLMLLAK